MKRQMKLILVLFYCVINVLFSAKLEAKEEKFNPKELVKVFIDKKTKTTIWGRLQNNTKKMLLTIDELPKETTPSYRYSRFPLSSTEFIEVKLSPDKTKIAFSVYYYWAPWIGIQNLISKKIETIAYFYNGEVGRVWWSPNNRYIAYECASGYGPLLIIKDISTNKHILRITEESLGFDYEILYRKFKDWEFRFVKWSKDSKKIFFNIVVLSSDKVFGKWSINIDGSNLRRLR